MVLILQLKVSSLPPSTHTHTHTHTHTKLSLSLITGVCAACNKPILTKVINALGYQWHKEHFVCAHEQCGIELGNTTYYESNGKPYCEKDYHELFAPRCAYCNGPILEVNRLGAGGEKYY